MRVKSYFAGTVEAAMSLAGRELGEDALLIYSREASPEARYLGKYEVVFALACAASGPADLAGLAETPTVAGAVPSNSIADALTGFQSQFAGIRDRLDHLSSIVHRGSWLSQALPTMQGGLEPVLTQLLRAEVPEEMSAEVMETIYMRLQAAPGADAQACLREALEARCAADARLGLGASKVVALIGPPGSGKTSTLVKLAARYGLAARRPAQLLSFDTCRIAGAEQLRIYAGILGIGFQALETTRGMLQALEEHRGKELILVDTAGMSAQDGEGAAELEQLFHLRDDIDVHLVLPASMKPADAGAVVDRFARFHPRKLLFTRLDETSTYGPVWAEPVKRGLPVSFLCDGPQIPEDIHEANPKAIVDLLLGRVGRGEGEDRSAAAA